MTDIVRYDIIKRSKNKIHLKINVPKSSPFLTFYCYSQFAEKCLLFVKKVEEYLQLHNITFIVQKRRELRQIQDVKSKFQI